MLSQPTYTPGSLTFPSQLDRLVGLAMLVVATTVFLYYTTWTLLMVRPTKHLTTICAFLLYITLLLPHKRVLIPLPSALRRSRSPPPRLLSAPRLGHPHTSHSHPSRIGSRRELFERGHDTE